MHRSFVIEVLFPECFQKRERNHTETTTCVEDAKSAVQQVGALQQCLHGLRRLKRADEGGVAVDASRIEFLHV